MKKLGHESRGGVRGGQDSFSWDSVKQDRYRENYLGHSIRAPMGRWAKQKDIFWYNKDKGKDADKEKLRKEEIARIKQHEADVLAVALGFKQTLGTDAVSTQELDEAIRKEQEEHDEPTSGKGLGFEEQKRFGIKADVRPKKLTDVVSDALSSNRDRTQRRRRSQSPLLKRQSRR